MDVAVTSTFSRRNVTLENPADAYGLRKHAKYDEGFKGTPYLFCAAVLETTGGYSEEALSFFRQLFRFAARQQNTKLSVYAGRAWARVACNVQASVASAILHRAPTGGHPARADAVSKQALEPCSDELAEDAEGGKDDCPTSSSFVPTPLAVPASSPRTPPHTCSLPLTPTAPPFSPKLPSPSPATPTTVTLPSTSTSRTDYPLFFLRCPFPLLLPRVFGSKCGTLVLLSSSGGRVRPLQSVG